MIGTMKKALEYAMAKSENPAEIKDCVEKYFAGIGGDRRYKFKWKAVSANPQYIFSGIFEYHGSIYYFYMAGDRLELEYHNQ